MKTHTFDSRAEASTAAANALASCLSRRLELQKRASVIVTGGSSPAGVYRALSQKPLAWDRVDVVLSDERWVSPDSDDSNEKLVRDTLMTAAAADATLLPMYSDGVTPEARIDALNDALKLKLPFSAALLGVGADGHFASLFPDAENLEQGLDTEDQNLALAVDTEASPYRRISLSLSAIARSDTVILLMFGDEKREVVERALDGDPSLPLSSLLRQKLAPVELYWAP